MTLSERLVKSLKPEFKVEPVTAPKPDRQAQPISIPE